MGVRCPGGHGGETNGNTFHSKKEHSKKENGDTATTLRIPRGGRCLKTQSEKKKKCGQEATAGIKNGKTHWKGGKTPREDKVPVEWGIIFK